MIKIGLYQKLIDEAMPHSPLEAELCKQVDRLSEELKQMEKRLPRTLAQQMDAISKLPGPYRKLFE